MAAEVKDWLRRSVEDFGHRIEAVGDDQWEAPTPNADWDVRALVGHVVDEQLWMPPLLAGGTIDEVAGQIPADPLDDEPAVARQAALAAVDDVDLDRTVHLSFGDVPAEEYLMQLLADHVVHGWDLARATGQDERLDPELLAAVASWFDEREAMYREGGVIGPAVQVDSDDPQDRLLARFGRDPR